MVMVVSGQCRAMVVAIGGGPCPSLPFACQWYRLVHPFVHKTYKSMHGA